MYRIVPSGESGKVSTNRTHGSTLKGKLVENFLAVT